MLFADPYTRASVRESFAIAATAIALNVVGVTLVCSTAWAQPVNPPTTKPAPLADVLHTGPQWQELNPAQQKILQPLAGTWNSLPGERKSKWIALAQTYPSLAPAEQEKLQSRMAEWAALNPRERERARLNFAETKKRTSADRNADWEAYQALSPEEKQRLAAQAATKPTGAAVAVKPVDPSKLTPVPVTRRTPEQGDPAKVSKPQLDRNTLLPRPPSTISGASAPAN